MPAARYWRVVGLQSIAGGALELSAFHLYLAGSRVDASATLTCTVPPSSGAVANLQDNDTATVCRWLDISAPGFALVWDFGVGVTQEVLALRLGAGALHAEWLDSLTLQSSSDGILWATWGCNVAFTWPGAGTLQTTPADGDAHIHSTSLLLHCEGPNGSIALVDSSLAPLAMTVLGVGKISTAQSKFGGSSFDTSGGGYAVYAGATAPSGTASLVFGTADFTVEFWVRASLALQVTNYPRLLAVGNYLTPGGWNLVYPKPSGGALILDLYSSSGVDSALNCGTLPDNVWTHIAFTRRGTTFRTFMNGVVQSTGISSVDLSSPHAFTVGSESAFTGNFKGFFDEIRVTKGVARYVANFTPPTEPYVTPAVGLPRAPALDRVRIAVASPVPPHSALSAPPLLLVRDVEVGGPGTIYGTTKTKGTPNLPTKARVVLLHQRSKLPVREVWSDPTTGDFAFEGIDTRQEFLTLAEDAAGNFRPVAASRLVPEVAP